VNLQNRGIKEKSKNSKKLVSLKAQSECQFQKYETEAFFLLFYFISFINGKSISTFKTKLLFIPFKSSKVKNLVEALTSVASKI
jgi:hypothetical protein